MEKENEELTTLLFYNRQTRSDLDRMIEKKGSRIDKDQLLADAAVIARKYGIDPKDPRAIRAAFWGSREGNAFDQIEAYFK